MAQRTSKVVSRRYPRFTLDVDWFVESAGCSTMGRGLEVSVRGALLPVKCSGEFAGPVTLFLSLPLREQMFKAHCTAHLETGRGWVLSFDEVSPDDLQLLGHTLITEFGMDALPNLERRPALEVDL
jgi:hypothetical protein